MTTIEDQFDGFQPANDGEVTDFVLLDEEGFKILPEDLVETGNENPHEIISTRRDVQNALFTGAITEPHITNPALSGPLNARAAAYEPDTSARLFVKVVEDIAT